MTMIYEIVSGQPVARLPSGAQGELHADGERFLNPAQMSAKFGGTEDTWREHWAAVWQGYLPDGETVDTATPEQIETARRSAADDIYRAIRFSHLTDDEWLFVRTECKRRRLHPMEIAVKHQISERSGRREIVIMTKIGVLQRVAQATGFRNGETAPEFCAEGEPFQPGPWPANRGTPYAARVLARRKDIAEPFEGIAYFEQCAQYVDDERTKLEECWRAANGGPQLGKCARAAALRLAYEELSDLFILDEMRVSSASTEDEPPAKLTESGEFMPKDPPRLPAASGMALPSSAAVAMDGFFDDPRRAKELVDDTTPSLDALRYELVMRTEACENQTQAQDFIDRCRLRWPKTFRLAPDGFCAMVLRKARKQMMPA